jgi:HEAT repeat protein
MATPDEIIALIRDHGLAGRRQVEEAPGPDKVAQLCGALEAAKDPHVRAVLSNIFASLGDPQALPCLLRALDDPDSAVVAAAEDAIGNSVYQQTVPASLYRRLGERLLELFTAEGQPREVRTGAQYALGLLGYRPAVPALVAALDDEAPIVRWNSAEALAHIGDPATRHALESRASREHHPRVARFITSALEELSQHEPPA